MDVGGQEMNVGWQRPKIGRRGVRWRPIQNTIVIIVFVFEVDQEAVVPKDSQRGGVDSVDRVNGSDFRWDTIAACK